MKDSKKKLVEKAKKSPVKEAMVGEDTKHKAGFLIIGLALLILVCCGIYWAKHDVAGEKKDNRVSDARTFKEEYESLNGKENTVGGTYMEVSISQNNPVQYATFDKVLEVLESGSGVIYFGFPECPWCRNLIPNLLEAADNVGVDKIYYLNAKDERDVLELDEKNQVVTKKEGSENYKKLLQKLDAHLSEYTLIDQNKKTIKTGEKRLYFPTVVVVKEGKVVGFHEGTVESQTDSKVLLTEEQKKELIEMLEEDMQKMITCDGAC